MRSEQIRPAVAIMQELSVVNNPNPVAVIDKILNLFKYQ